MVKNVFFSCYLVYAYGIAKCVAIFCGRGEVGFERFGLVNKRVGAFI